jgi:ribonuclease HII
MLKPCFNKTLIEAGCDEAGRGCLSGPVFAAAVILPKNISKILKFGNVNDSKKLSEKMRYQLRPIIEQEALAFAVAQVSCREIDRINILNASFFAMHQAIDKLKIIPQTLLIDGNRFKKYKAIPHRCIIEGDGKFLSIAAASVLAKTYRDDYMNTLHEKFPNYGWNQNKGYGTRSHRLAIAKFGPVQHHRMSFRLLPV